MKLCLASLAARTAATQPIPPERGDQNRHVFHSHFSHLIAINPPAHMHENVPSGNDLFPRQSRNLRSPRLGDTSRGFPRGLQRVDHRSPQPRVCVKIIPRPVRDEQKHIHRGVQHVLLPLAFVGAALGRITRHAAASPRATPRERRIARAAAPCRVELRANKRAQFHRHPCEDQKTWHLLGKNLNQDIHIASKPEAMAALSPKLAQNAAKERELRNAVAAAEIFDLVPREVDAIDEHESALYIGVEAR